MIDEEFFGNDNQQALMRRAKHLWAVVREDPRMSFYGRSVSLATAGPIDLALMISLARLQGITTCMYVRRADAEALRIPLEAEGLIVNGFETLRGGSGTLEAAHLVLAENSLPEDLEVISIAPETSTDMMAQLDEVTSGCGMLLPMGSVLRGITRKSVCLLARDSDARPVASAASFAPNLPDNSFGQEAWWGVLATREDRRGERIAMTLGAMAILQMHERHGFSAFTAGVRKGNSASEKLCAKLAILPSDYVVLSVVDPIVFGDDRMSSSSRAS